MAVFILLENYPAITTYSRSSTTLCASDLQAPLSCSWSPRESVKKPQDGQGPSEIINFNYCLIHVLPRLWGALWNFISSFMWIVMKWNLKLRTKGPNTESNHLPINPASCPFSPIGKKVYSKTETYYMIHLLFS